MGQQRNWLIGIGIGVIVFIFGIMIIASFVVNSNGQQVAYSVTSSAISATNSFVGTAISATSVAKQNAPVDYRAGDQSGGVADVTTNVQVPTNTQNRIVLKNATVSITVKDPASTIDTISKLAQDQGGWVVSSNTYQQASASGAKLTYGSITIRVPAAKLHSILDQIKASAVSVDTANITGEDVTDQYTGLMLTRGAKGAILAAR